MHYGCPLGSYGLLAERCFCFRSGGRRALRSSRRGRLPSSTLFHVVSLRRSSGRRGSRQAFCLTTESHSATAAIDGSRRQRSNEQGDCFAVEFVGIHGEKSHSSNFETGGCCQPE